jgi:hypothetical protein
MMAERVSAMPLDAADRDGRVTADAFMALWGR